MTIVGNDVGGGTMSDTSDIDKCKVMMVRLMRQSRELEDAGEALLELYNSLPPEQRTELDAWAYALESAGRSYAWEDLAYAADAARIARSKADHGDR